MLAACCLLSPAIALKTHAELSLGMAPPPTSVTWESPAWWWATNHTHIVGYIGIPASHKVCCG